MKRKQAYRGKLRPLVVKGNRLSFALLFLFLTMKTYAQDPLPYQVEGKVISAVDNRPLPGASVQVKDSQLGTNTDENGRFTLMIPDSTAVLLVSFLGYKSQELELRLPLTNSLMIVLEQDAEQLDEVIVSTGYQKLSPERTTGSFTQPDKRMFNLRVSTDLISRLEGITSGLVFNAPGTMVTGSEEFLSIRGRSTIYANSQPLIVVDNFPYEGDINNINPNDIENITVLKDAAAASIWGARAGNGVIVITTRKGRRNQPIQVTLTANTTIADKPDLFYDPNYLTSADMIDLEMDLYDEGFYDGDINSARKPPVSPVAALLHQIDQGVFTEAGAVIDALRGNDLRRDLEEYFYRNAVNQQYALNLSGGSEKHMYYMSAGYDKNLEMRRENDFNRITLKFDNTFTLLEDLTLTAGINYAQNHTSTNNALADLMTSFGGALPYTSLADDSGSALPVVHRLSPLYKSEVLESGFLDWRFYPLEELNNSLNTTTGNRRNIRLTAGVQTTVIDGLKAGISYQYQRENIDSRNLALQESYYTRDLINRYSSVDSDGRVSGYNIPLGAILQRNNAFNTSNNIRAQLDYVKHWRFFVINAIAGIEAREVVGENESFMYYGYDNETATFANVNTTTLFPLNPSSTGTIFNGLGAGGITDRFRSYYANASFTYKNRYILSGSGRMDQSNLFGVKTNQKTVPLWSFGGRWHIDNESFYSLNWLPKLSFRITYGYNGNIDKSVTAITTFRMRGVPAGGITNQRYASISNLGNPDLRWEKIGMLNLGIDFSLAHNILSGSIEFFHKKGKDIIGDQLMPPTSGTDELRGNYAAIEGNGIDIQLNSRSIIHGDLWWESSFLYSRATDKVTRFSVPKQPSQLIGTGKSISPYEGLPVYNIHSYRWAGLDPQTGAPRGYDREGNISQDYSSLRQPQTADELIYHGASRPTIFGGLRNTFIYKSFNISFNISYKLGYYFRRKGIDYRQLYNSYEGYADYANRWQQPGDELFTNVPSMIYPADQARDYFYSFSEVTVEKGDHIRLQDIAISYNIKPEWTQTLGLNSLQITAYFNNIGLLWKATETDLDPDYPLGGIVNPRTVALGLKVNF